MCQLKPPLLIYLLTYVSTDNFYQSLIETRPRSQTIIENMLNQSFSVNLNSTFES